MKIVAFLQNMWVRNPRTAASVSKWDPVSRERERMIAYALFAGCLTGKRLQGVLGSWCERIVWQEANPTVSTDPKAYYPPEPNHVAAVLAKHNPDIVLCFTKQGESVIQACCVEDCVVFYSCVHPACRAPDTMNRLWDLRRMLDKMPTDDQT